MLAQYPFSSLEQPNTSIKLRRHLRGALKPPIVAIVVSRLRAWGHKRFSALPTPTSDQHH